MHTNHEKADTHRRRILVVANETVESAVLNEAVRVGTSGGRERIARNGYGDPAMDDLAPVGETRISRRASIVKAGGLVAAALGAGAWKFADAAEGGGPAGVASGAVSCVLTPEQTEGPYFLQGDKLRANITDGRPGTPLTLRLTVVDASTCKPISGAAVDIWHCDAGGAYSGVQGVSGTFLRGVQKTNASGIATFHTIYPGWYRGRTVHIHVKVFVAGNVVHTGQLYFADATTDAVYKRSPYNRRPNRSTRNTDDSIYRNGGSRSSLALRKSGKGYVGTITMGVSRG